MMHNPWLAALFGVMLLVPLQGRAAEEPELPWDYDPYRVLIWIAGVDSRTVEQDLREPVLRYLDRDFAALWQTEIAAAPAGLAALASRNLDALSYQTLTANDPVVAIKRDHQHASRIRFPADVADRVSKIRVAADYAAQVAASGDAAGNPTLHGMVSRFEPHPGDLLEVQSTWQENATEAVLLPRGMAIALQPQPKIVELEVQGRVGAMLEPYDKLFFVSLRGEASGADIWVREMDCPMRLMSPAVHDGAGVSSEIPQSIARAVTAAFAPVVRLDEVGSKLAQGRVRAGGLITDADSPAAVVVGDFLQPVIRRDNHSGEPLFLQIIDWTYLTVTEREGTKVSLKTYLGRAGALHGRRNSRTHRMALKIRPVLPATTLRLHAKGDPEAPLVGYDVYERNLESDEMTFVGQTDWDGQLRVEKSSVPLRLLYVKNGGAVLARLPLVPGQSEFETADLLGDDIRLQAEAYIRGVQNAIIDLVAIRKLLAARIRMRIENGQLEEARELLESLRQEPSYEKIADDMAVTQTAIRSDNRSEQRKIDNLFAETRTLLVKHISPSLIRELETELAASGAQSAESRSDGDAVDETPSAAAEGPAEAGTAAAD